MGRSLQDPDHLQGLLNRVARLKPDSPGRWGTLTAHTMICHVTDSLRVALGDQKAKDCSTALSRTVAKWAILHLGIPAPRGRVKTVPEMLVTPAEDWAQDLANLQRCMLRVAAGEAHSPHPAFGPMTPAAWAVLAAKHLHHHLEQFSC